MSNNINRIAFRASVIVGVIAGIIASTESFAQVSLSAYADSDGYVDVQKLTCAQLAGTFQEDADLLAAWYSG